MIKIGLTGNFYSGQSDVVKIFEKLDVAVFDADLVLKYLLNYSKPHLESITEHFGKSAYSLGLLNLPKFQTTKDWDDVIDLLEFDIVKSYEKFRLQHQNDLYTIFKFSFLFERGLNKNMDYNISCYRPKYHRKSDLMNKTRIDTYTINQILSNEMDELIKNNESDFIINNYPRTYGSDSFEIKDLQNKVEEIHKTILKKKPQDNFLGL